ncbi:amidase domain-containing protein [bacterium]
MLKRFVSVFIAGILFFNVTSAYSYNDYNSLSSGTDDNNYNRFSNNYNNYNSFSSFAFNPSRVSLFTIDIRDQFNSNTMFEGARNSWRMNDYYSDSGKSYTESYNTFVAPNTEPIDYCGVSVKDSNAWCSFSYASNLYESQSFSNVKMSEHSSAYQSFDILIGKQGFNTRNTIDNISYNAENLPDSLRMTTQDIADNSYTQDISNITYKENPQYQDYNNLMDLCETNAGRDNYYMWGELQRQIEVFAEPARFVVDSFDMQVTNAQGLVTNMKFENIEWDNRGITGFDAAIFGNNNVPDIKMQVFAVFEGDSFNGFNIKIDTPQGVQELSVEPGGDLSNVFADYLKDYQNPIELAEAVNIQIGDAKIALFSQNYNENALFDNTSKTYEVEYSVTNVEKAENSLINEIFQLAQTDKYTAAEVIWNTNLNDVNADGLTQIRDTIRDNIVDNFDSFTNQREFESQWGHTLQTNALPELKLQGNMINTDMEIKTDKGTYNNITFVIKEDKLMVAGANLTKANGVEQYISSQYEPKPYAPVKGVDNSSYDIPKMTEYAEKWYNPTYDDETKKAAHYNPKYEFIVGKNCANYVSQCLMESGFSLKESLTNRENKNYINNNILGKTITYCDYLDSTLSKNPNVTKSFIKFSNDYIKSGKQDFYNHEVFKNVKVGDGQFAHAAIVTKYYKYGYDKIFVSANTSNHNNKHLSYFFGTSNSAYDRVYIYSINRTRSY